jgi:hypothetical protein
LWPPAETVSYFGQLPPLTTLCRAPPIATVADSSRQSAWQSLSLQRNGRRDSMRAMSTRERSIAAGPPAMRGASLAVAGGSLAVAGGSLAVAGGDSAPVGASHKAVVADGATRAAPARGAVVSERAAPGRSSSDRAASMAMPIAPMAPGFGGTITSRPVTAARVRASDGFCAGLPWKNTRSRKRRLPITRFL